MRPHPTRGPLLLVSIALALIVAACVWLALAAASRGATTSITDRLTTDKAAVEVVSLPAGTDHVGVAVMKTLSGEGVKEGINLPATQKTYTPPAGYPVVDVIARSSTGKAIGSWAGRLQTVPAGVKQAELAKLEAERATAEGRVKQLVGELHAEEGVLAELQARIERVAEEDREEAEPPTEPPVEELPAEVTEEVPAKPAFLPGLNAGYWGESETGPKGDLHTLADGHPFVVRLDTPPSLAPWEALGLKVIADESGPYSSAGVSGLNHKAYVERVVTFVKANPHVYAVEVLNEPGGSWFWGSNSESATNKASYAQLLVEVHEALVANFGAARPLELASWDGGHDSSNGWGEGWAKNTTALADVDGVTSHPYGGTGPKSTAILGDRKLVEGAHTQSHKPVYITEVGFPDGHPNGDSDEYTETEEARGIYNFAVWASSTGYVPLVTFYGYRDSSEGGGYGIVTHAGARKSAFTALQQFTAGEPCGVCN
jgi:hypothetical protein